MSKKEAASVLKKRFQLLEIAPVNPLVLEDAFARNLNDFEDAVIESSGYHVGVDAIVTRDAKGFSKARCSVYTPGALIAAMKKLP